MLPHPDAPFLTTLVLLDPTSVDGETALDLLDEQDHHVILQVLLSGPASHALRDFARAEDIDMPTAGWRYLEQVVDRLGLAPEQVLAMTTIGPSAATELADVAAGHELRRVLLPSSVDRYEPGVAQMLATCVSAPVLIATAYATSA